MKRRDFLHLGLLAPATWVLAKVLRVPQAHADVLKLSAATIMKEGISAPISGYCQNPDKQPNKFCPDWPKKPGHCESCQFFNTDKSLGKLNGKEYATCQLLLSFQKPYVSNKAYCSTFVQKAKA